MQKIRKAFYALSSASLLAPALASAQLDTGRISGDSQLESTSIVDIITSLMQWLLLIVGILAVIGFVISGILYVTAAGDEGQIDKAKKALVYSIIGIIVALIGLIVITAVTNLLGGQSQF